MVRARGVVATVALVLWASACSDGGDTVPICRDLSSFPGRLQELSSRLSEGGLSFEDYSERVVGIRAEYDRIALSQLSDDCIAKAVTPLEDAMDAYVKVYDQWNECNGNLDCDIDEPTVRQHWASATKRIERASAYLDSA